jgi:pimeloyl-ACP methyl ester carboxylesterase
MSINPLHVTAALLRFCQTERIRLACRHWRQALARTAPKFRDRNTDANGDQPMSTEAIAEVTRSADGTSIGFVRLGSGPAVVFVHGSLSTGDDWLQVATAMAGQFTCFIMDRRGRGRSGDASDYSLDREYEDIKAVLDVAGPGTHLLGHSYGAICALGAALRAPIGHLVLYEPPLPVEGPVVGTALVPYRAAVASYQLDEALTIGLKDIVHLSAGEISALRPTPLWKKRAALTPTWTRELEAIDRLNQTT